MPKIADKALLPFLILTLAFVYRMLLMTWAVYPPGADIGLHQSVIKSITLSGNTNFLWNNYQMGGGLSLTFPGYHIFVSYIILLTGIPDYLAHSLVVSFFSSLIVLVAYLITRAVWMESTALIVAFLVAISRFDIEMLLWGGYPNVITLMLMPLIFYLFLQKNKFSPPAFLATTALLSGTVFLTHSLSAVMFVGITFTTVLLTLIFSKKLGIVKKQLLIWVVPIFLGAILVSPFLVEVAPAYVHVNGETFTGGISDIRQALLSTRVLPLEWVIPLFGSVIFFFLFSRKYKGSSFTVPALYFVAWILVPMIFTQGYLVGIYTDYNRFLYFIILPIIMLIGLGIDHGASFFARVIDTYLTLTRNAGSRRWIRLSRKTIYSSFLLGFLLFAFLCVPLFVTPSQGIAVQSFYQVMNDKGYEAIKWARENTAAGSVFVSDALYGWWFSGFAERPTLSAVDPQYLTLARELEPAKTAKNLLDTDYLVDNGLIQVREDGGYIGRHNPMFLAKLNWTYFPYPFMHFNNSASEIKYRVGEKLHSLSLTELPVQEMWVESDGEHATIVVKKGNDFFNYTQLTTVYKGSRFVNMTITLESAIDDVSLDWLTFKVHSKGKVVTTLENETVGLLDEGVKALAQLIFDKSTLKLKVINKENPCILELEYNLKGKSEAQIQLMASTFSVTDDPEVYKNPENTEKSMTEIVLDNLKAFHEGKLLKLSQENGEKPLIDVFDYKYAIKKWAISYIACRDSELIPKFAKDPAFSLVFINDEVAIFGVKRS
ncbi:MAG: hypothetical protein QXP44_05560 [Candidatus Bathyarchaeia archaeon]